MRELADTTRIERFMRELGRLAGVEGRVYLTGGATAVLNGWRQSTVDIDIKLIPDHDQILRAIPRLKEELEVNVELASPSDFIPLPPGWEDRSLASGLVDAASARAQFDEIEPELYRFPAIDPKAFRASVETLFPD